MFHFFKRTVCSVVAILLLGLVFEAQADPVRVVASGGVTLDRGNPAFGFTLSNDTSLFRARYQSNSPSISNFPIQSCFSNCRAGDSFSPNFSISIGGSRTSPTLNGVAATLVSTNTTAILDGFKFSDIDFSGTNFVFTGGRDFIPMTDLRVLGFTLNYNMTGVIVINGNSTPVTGFGKARFFYVRDGDTYNSSGMSYSGQRGTEPTPEPTTLFLLGTGIAGIAGYTARRRKRKIE